MGAENEGIDVNVQNHPQSFPVRNHENRAVIYSINPNSKDNIPKDTPVPLMPKKEEGEKSEGIDGQYRNIGAWLKWKESIKNPVTNEESKGLEKDPFVLQDRNVKKGDILEMKDENGKRGIYMGDTKDNKPHGFGVFRTEEKVKVGNWKEGKFIGIGIESKFAPGNERYLSGEFGENEKIKKGTEISKTYRWYEGEFNDKGKRHGIGEADTPKVKYRGDFVEGNAHGKGQIYFKKTGSKYEGQIANNTITGEGRYTWSDLKYYEGIFDNGKIQGQNERSKIDIGIKKRYYKEQQLPEIHFGPTKEEAFYLEGKYKASHIYGEHFKEVKEICRRNNIDIDENYTKSQILEKVAKENHETQQKILNSLFVLEKKDEDKKGESLASLVYGENFIEVKNICKDNGIEIDDNYTKSQILEKVKNSKLDNEAQQKIKEKLEVLEKKEDKYQISNYYRNDYKNLKEVCGKYGIEIKDNDTKENVAKLLGKEKKETRDKILEELKELEKKEAADKKKENSKKSKNK